MKRIISIMLLAVCLVITNCWAGSAQESVTAYTQIDQETALKMMACNDDHIVVDVRHQDEYDDGHIPGAILIPNESIGNAPPEALPDLDQIILIYCRSGNRSKQAAEKLSAIGYKNVYEFGGINTWTGEIVKEDADSSAERNTEKNAEENNMNTIYLAGGCFWGMQKFFDQFDGVINSEVGYANGPDIEPSYEDVCRNSGHAETVKIDYDPERISLTELLNYYFMVIDPFSVNKQDNDIGTQYRTGIYYVTDSQLPEIESVYKAKEEEAGQDLTVELKPLENFFSAEEYHQKYLDKNPGGYCHIPSKMFDLEQTEEE